MKQIPTLGGSEADSVTRAIKRFAGASEHVSNAHASRWWQGGPGTRELAQGKDPEQLRRPASDPNTAKKIP